MVEKRARKDVQKLSAKVDAFISTLDRKEHHESHQKPHAHVSHQVKHSHSVDHAKTHHTTQEHASHHASHEKHVEPVKHHASHQTSHAHPHVIHHEKHAGKKKTAHHTHHALPHPQHRAAHMKVKKLPSATTPSLRNEREIALSFASQVHKKFDSLIKATVLFGSQAKKSATPSSDIDLVILVDDASVNWDLELIAWYREELGKLLAASKHSHELHVNTIKLTTWWQDLMHGDPVVLNILRYGEPLIDIAGFFKPLKILLQDGKIHSTPEAVYNALQRAPLHLARSHASQLGALEGVYWTMVDSAQAALITAGQLPPSPEHMTGLLKQTFVDKGLLKMDLVYWFRDCYALHKSIAHGQAPTVKGGDVDLWQQRAETFMKKMTDIIDHLLSAR